jgi:hypothetical protein
MTFQNEEMKKRDLQICFSHSNDAITINVLGRGWRAPKAKWLSPSVTNERTNDRRPAQILDDESPKRAACCCPDDTPDRTLDHGAPNRRSAHRQDRRDDRQVPVDHPVRYVLAEARSGDGRQRAEESEFGHCRRRCGMEFDSWSSYEFYVEMYRAAYYTPPSMVVMGVAACHDQMPFFPSLHNGRVRCKVIRLSVIIRQKPGMRR